MNIEISDIQFTTQIEYEYAGGKYRTIEAITVTLLLGDHPVFTRIKPVEDIYFGLDEEDEDRAKDEALAMFARRLSALIEGVGDDA